MRTHIPGTLKWRETPPETLVFALAEDGRWAHAFTESVRPELMAWACSHQCAAAAANVFNGTWEAVQNALKHGAAPGGAANVQCRYADPATLEVTITQDLDWPDWHLVLNIARVSNPVLADGGFGTLIMLRLSREAVFLPEERSVRLRFSCPAQNEEA